MSFYCNYERQITVLTVIATRDLFTFVNQLVNYRQYYVYVACLSDSWLLKWKTSVLYRYYKYVCTQYKNPHRKLISACANSGASGKRWIFKFIISLFFSCICVPVKPVPSPPDRCAETGQFVLLLCRSSHIFGNGPLAKCLNVLAASWRLHGGGIWSFF